MEQNKYKDELYRILLMATYLKLDAIALLAVSGNESARKTISPEHLEKTLAKIPKCMVEAAKNNDNEVILMAKHNMILIDMLISGENDHSDFIKEFSPKMELDLNYALDHQDPK